MRKADDNNSLVNTFLKLELKTNFNWFLFLFSGAHTLWELPVLTMRFGGVVFILIYLIMFLLLGTPMLLLEMTMGQYSALSPTKLYRNLCPVSKKVLWFEPNQNGWIVQLNRMFGWSLSPIYLLETSMGRYSAMLHKKIFWQVKKICHLICMNKTVEVQLNQMFGFSLFNDAPNNRGRWTLNHLCK